ncbi:hypothetical protein SFK227_2773 [Shigella flexneri K-227]|uniref:Uncharacterized protein n=1 Tax=Shigella flexneri K-227 TaxID=766147 RepID=F5NX97_SHIFL|nr:hypothetical protein SFK272_2935 [Shigella flexneri K-272]EGK36218.1 hypothetical protein SFK227_2773 [Shigella flexneri K-227]
MASPPIRPAFSLMNSNAVKFSPRHCDRKSVQAYKPALTMCGNSRQQAMTWLIDLEMLTAP